MSYMQNEAQNGLTERLNFGLCDVCATPAIMLTHDVFLTVKIDDPGQSKTFARSVEIRRCQAHSRPGKLIAERERADAYFARLRATEGAEI